MSFPDFGAYLTPAKLIAVYGDERGLEELTRLSKKTGEKCTVCGLPVWRYADCGLCFFCTTGESDASDDIEVIPEEE